MPTPRTGVTAVALDDQIYVMGGVDEQGKVRDIVEKYNPVTDTWQTGASLRTARFNAAAVVLDGDIYLLGGQDSSASALKKVEVFVAEENDWKSFDNLNEEREGLAAVVIEGQIHVMGGSNENGDILDSVEFFDTDEDKWEFATDWTLDVPRALFGYAVQDDIAYSIGGFSSFGLVGLVQAYSEGEGAQDLPVVVPGRGGLAATALDDAIYAMGGRRSNNQVVNTVNKYIPDETRWDTAPDMLVGRERFAAVTLDDQILVFGGNTTDGDVLGSVEAFTNSVVPNVANDVLVTDEDVSMSINVLVNDSDPAGGNLSISSFSQPANGSVTQLNASTLSYQPNPDYFGSDQFQYTALNETGGTAQATVNVSIQPVNDPPVFLSSPVTGAAQNSDYTYDIVVSDVDLDALTLENVSSPPWISLTPLQNNTAQLQGMPGSDLGDFDVVLSVSDGTVSIEQSFTITVVEGAPGSVSLLTPADEAQDVPVSVTLAWEAAGASSYDLQVSLEEMFVSPLVNESDLLEPSFQPEGLENLTTYYWRVRASNAAGDSDWSEVSVFTTAMDTDTEDELPTRDFTLQGNFPNPFSNQTQVMFDLGIAAQVELDVFDLQGRHVANITRGFLPAGTYQFIWEGEDASGLRVASGSYLLRLKQGSAQDTKLILLIR